MKVVARGLYSRRKGGMLSEMAAGPGGERAAHPEQDRVRMTVGSTQPRSLGGGFRGMLKRPEMLAELQEDTEVLRAFASPHSPPSGSADSLTASLKR